MYCYLPSDRRYLRSMTLGAPWRLPQECFGPAGLVAALRLQSPPNQEGSRDLDRAASYSVSMSLIRRLAVARP
ncbi:hypothetical protein LIA77_07620 [Sarocladium implicatum]|nr:hypothetical protein LIA77_07620 [Sarocladium implicatum]